MSWTEQVFDWKCAFLYIEMIETEIETEKVIHAFLKGGKIGKATLRKQKKNDWKI